MKRLLKRVAAGINILLLVMITSPAFAGQVKSVEWRSKGKEPVLSIKLSSSVASYETRSFEGGKRLRIIINDTSLGTSILDLEGSGIVKGVFPYLAGNGTSTNIDLLLSQPGQVKVSKKSRELRIKVSKLRGGSRAARNEMTISKGGNAITDVRFTKLPGSRVQITLKMAQTPVKPSVFTITNPARISLDFPNTGIHLLKKSVPIKTGAVDTVNVVQSANRTRVVLTLYQAVAYNTSVEENAYVITVESPTVGSARNDQSRTTRFAGSSKGGKHRITNIDFRREADGGAKIIVKLSDSAVGVDIREQAGEILVDFLDTRAPASLRKRLDVIDFATPVKTIDTFSRGRNTRIVITPTGTYEHLAYQAGNVFTINVKPIPEGEKQKKIKDEFGYSGEKLSLNFQRISVRDALQVLADFTGLNFVISDSVSGNLTLRLKDVPWDQAMDIILKSKNLGQRKSGNVVVIAPERELAAKDKALLEAKKTVRELEPLVSELIRINYAKASDIAALLKSVKAVETGITTTNPFQTVSYAGEQKITENSLLSKRGQVTVDERTNSILIQDTPTKIREVRKLIALLDQPVEQVMIESRLVEATSSFAKSLGARFGVTRTGNPPTDGLNITGNLEGNVDIINSGTIVANTDALNVNLPSTGIGFLDPGQLALTLARLGTGELLQLELTALEQEGQGKIISSPRIITANQQKATIEQGQERQFSVGSGVSKKQTAVLKLEVTPQITPDRRIILDVEVSKNNFADVSAGLINKKKIKTSVLLDNGETIAIGGIYEQDSGETITQVPLFGRLPIIGWMFKNKERKDNKTELLIFLTPKILSDKVGLR
ncbi:MAG: type IV pilus secretin PilQ [Acidiferrobacterales bacterium]